MARLNFGYGLKNIWQKYRWWILAFCLVSIVFVCAGAVTIIRIGGDGEPTNFDTFYFVSFITKESGFFGCLVQRLLINIGLWGLCFLVLFNRYLLIVSVLGCWYICYCYAINLFALISAFGLINIFLLLVILLAFVLIYIVVFSFCIFSFISHKVYHSPSKPFNWLLIFALLALVETICIGFVSFFVIIIV